MPEASDLQTLIVDFYTGKSVCCLSRGTVRKAAFFFSLLLVFFCFFFLVLFCFFFFRLDRTRRSTAFLSYLMEIPIKT